MLGALNSETKHVIETDIKSKIRPFFESSKIKNNFGVDTHLRYVL